MSANTMPDSSQTKACAPDDDIRHMLGQCSLGAILVAVSPRGLCAILLGDDAHALESEHLQRFPASQPCEDSPESREQLAQVVSFVDTPALGLKLPLDMRGTAFQKQIWQALQNIPLGSTLSYTELAARIGSPTAVRAVAGACGANHLAVAIPCHRVVRHDGSLAGYRWGLERKRQLLEKEAACRTPPLA